MAFILLAESVILMTSIGLASTDDDNASTSKFMVGSNYLPKIKAGKFGELTGTRLYGNQRPGWNPLTGIFQVVVASFRKFRIEVPLDKSLLLETAAYESALMGSCMLDHTEQLSFCDKEAIESPSDRVKGSVDPWRLCTVTPVEELKSIFRLLPAWATGIIFSAVYSQMGTLFVQQGNTMDLHVGKSFEIPSASVSLFDAISVIFLVPIYDRVIVPFSRRFTGHKNGFIQLQRLAIDLMTPPSLCCLLGLWSL